MPSGICCGNVFKVVRSATIIVVWPLRATLVFFVFNVVTLLFIVFAY